MVAAPSEQDASSASISCQSPPPCCFHDRFPLRSTCTVFAMTTYRLRSIPPSETTSLSSPGGRGHRYAGAGHLRPFAELDAAVSGVTLCLLEPGLPITIAWAAGSTYQGETLDQSWRHYMGGDLSASSTERAFWAAPPKALSFFLLSGRLAATALHQVLTVSALRKVGDRSTLSSSVGGAATSLHVLGWGDGIARPALPTLLCREPG